MGEEMIGLMKEKGMSVEGMVKSKDRITTVKTRIISNHQQMLRMDEEVITNLNTEDENKLMSVIKSLIDKNKIAVVIFEDYNKGVITERIISETIEICKQKNIPTCVDPKKKNFFAYKNVTLFKPNLKELREGLKTDIDIHVNGLLHLAVCELEERLQHSISLITLSEKGVYVKKGDEEISFPAHMRNITDVSGAGDTVIAVAALCVALKTDIGFMAELSNLAGGLVCEQTGVVPVDAKLLLEEAKNKLVSNR
jgi:rfaE bifunctional protein kinase chain/domain